MKTQCMLFVSMIMSLQTADIPLTVQRAAMQPYAGAPYAFEFDFIDKEAARPNNPIFYIQSTFILRNTTRLVLSLPT